MTKFYELPDSIECGKIKEYFEEYLSYYCNNTNSENVNYALSELLELADRQWHTYELLEECVKEKVEIDYIQKKHVKKPAGAKPGFVVYYTNFSMAIDSDISGIQMVSE